MPTTSYTYDLRRGEHIVATGYLTPSGSETLAVGDRIELGDTAGIVRDILPALGQHELRLIIELLPPQPSPDHGT